MNLVARVNTHTGLLERERQPRSRRIEDAPWNGTHNGRDTFIMRQRILGERVTHHDVRKALNNFLESGGRIVQLPDQKSEQLVVIGGEKYEEYESLSAIIAS